MRKGLLIGAGAVALVAIVVVGLTQASSDKPSKPKPTTVSLTQTLRELDGSPPPLAALHRQANQLLGGGKAAVRARLAALKGYPIVVNKWGSWCGPCALEFPFFQTAARTMGKRVAFVGVDTNDNDAAARAFLKRRPVSYPSYTDPHLNIAIDLKTGTNAPVTVFVNASGARYVHQGLYATQAKLDADIRRYALR